MAATPLATADDVAAIWRPLTGAETPRINRLIVTASAKLRHACPFDIDERMGLFMANPDDPVALDPVVVADVVATIVKRFMVNVAGYASETETTGPYSHSASYVNRYDKTGSDVRGAIQVIESDIDQLRPAVPAPTASSFRYRVPRPAVLIPASHVPARPGQRGIGPVIVPDVAPDTGVE